MESVLQFGTGGFLRGFAEYFIQAAIRQGKLAGGVVVVGSTGSGRLRDLAAQDGLYTLLTRGIESGRAVDEPSLIDVISRPLSARDQWPEVLSVARDPNLLLVVSNTTEVGIVLDAEDRIDLNPPRSFPGKLTAVLFDRARAFDFDRECGLIVLPCELIERNGDTLKGIVLDLAVRWRLGDAFVSWVEEANTFCNTLVDRIVSGIPKGDDAVQLEARLGYRDALLTVAEPYRLWAIEGDDAFARRFPLTGVDPGIVVTEDIEPFRERKVRILNGTHTAIATAAILAGLKTVSEAMQDPVFNRFIEQIAIREIVPTLASDPAIARRFAGEVQERFANPFIRHNLLDITFQQTRKLQVRVLPTLEAYSVRFGRLPGSIVLGLAAFILYHHPSRRDEAQGPKDDGAVIWEELWAGRSSSSSDDVRQVVEAFARNESIWGQRLDRIEGLVDALIADIQSVHRSGIRSAVEQRISEADRRVD